MPNIKSQKKRVLTSQKEQARNKSVRSDLKTALKKAETAIAAGAKKDEQADIVNSAYNKIDTAQRKGVIHKNTANRKKSAIGRKIDTK